MPESTTTERDVYELIGRLCSFWAHLDHTTNKLIQVILGCGADKAACIATQIDPVAGRMRLLKTLIMTTDQDADWKARATRWLNKIEGDISPKRNRIIHDAWDFNDSPIQIDRRVKIKKSGAHQPPGLITEFRSESGTEHILHIMEETLLCADALSQMAFDILERRVSPQKLPAETFLAQWERGLTTQDQNSRQ